MSNRLFDSKVPLIDIKSELSQSQKKDSYCGVVAIAGKPNVGKSTLLNHLIGQKVSITSRKPQTTRTNIIGIHTQDNIQIIYVDTPGIHKSHDTALNRQMNRTARQSLLGVAVILFVIDALVWGEEDQMVLASIKKSGLPVLLVINKIDRVADKERLLPYLDMLSLKFNFESVIPLSALTGHNLKQLEHEIHHYLPQAEHCFPEDQLTDRSSRFLAAEIVREKVIRRAGDEIPYEIAVEIEDFYYEERRFPKPAILKINALILVERKGQKVIIIGNKGVRLKQIGHDARVDMELLFKSPVMLQLWVKVKSGWSDDERALKTLGYHID